MQVRSGCHTTILVPRHLSGTSIGYVIATYVATSLVILVSIQIFYATKDKGMQCVNSNVLPWGKTNNKQSDKNSKLYGES